MLQRLAPTLVRHRRLVITGWIGFLVVAVLLGSSTFDRLVTDAEGAANTESAQAEEQLEELGQTPPDVIALIDGVPVDDPAVRADVVATSAEIADLDGVIAVANTYDDGDTLAALDGNASLVAVRLDRGLPDGEFDDLVETIEEELRSIAAPEVLVGGQAVLEEQSIEQTERDLQQAELISLPLVLVLAIVIFGGLIAASLPLVIALVAIPGALLVMWLVASVTDVHVFALNAATMLGLGLAIDYALLIVNRFREERSHGLDVPAAIERTVGTAGVTVAFSGLTVAVALAGFLVFDNDVFRSIGIGSMGVVLLAMFAAVTLLPALLAAFGHRIRPARNTERSGRMFHRISTVVQRRPGIIAAGLAVLLLALAAPFLGVRLQIPGPESLPESLESRQVFDAQEERFTNGGEDPITVVADTTGDVGGYVAEIESLEGVVAVAVRPIAGADVTVIDVVPAGQAQGTVAETLVGEIRDLDPPFEVGVTGPAADLVDQRAAIFDRLPWALAFVAVATLVLLFLLTGSVVMPFKAMVMNLLSLTATFGVLVWGFQDGNLGGLLGFESVGYLALWTPFLVFFIAFGLSMDYEVFLLSRIKEIYDETGDNDAAVSLGLQRTGRIITSAAVLIGVVFAAFATGDSIDMKTLGVGFALAILLDATVVRTLFVPATMKLMGDFNWWAPPALRRIHERFGLREPASAPAPPIDPETAPPEREPVGV